MSLIIKPSHLLKKTSVLPFIEKEKQMKKSHSQDILMETVYENERGFKHVDWKFNKKYLLPTDPPPFCDEKGKFTVDIKFYTPPIGYTWVSDWMLDLNGPVDEGGWSFAESFKATWTGSLPVKATVLVRRRKWTRMTRLITTTTPKALDNLKSDDGITGLVQRGNIDRERLSALKTYLSTIGLVPLDGYPISKNCLAAVLDEFDYEGSKLEACILLKELLQKNEEMLSVALSSLKFYSDRKALIDVISYAKLAFNISAST